MTTTITDAPTTDTTTVRPAWVTDELLGSWFDVIARDPEGTESIEAFAPYDESLTATVPASTSADVKAAVAAARRAQRTWDSVPWSSRADVVLRFHDLLVERQSEVLDLIQWEMGKARFSAWQEILQVATIARHYARHGRRYLAPNRCAVPSRG